MPVSESAVGEANSPKSLVSVPEARPFETAGGIELKPVYTPEDVSTVSYPQDLGHPGEYPFTRGVYPEMYRTKLWSMRQFCGAGTSKEVNREIKQSLGHGDPGLALSFDLPTQMGYDSDHPRAFGQVGRAGAAVDSLQDMEEIFQDVRLDQVSTSMAINGPAVIAYCMYLALAEKQGVRLRDLRGTIQNDVLKEYMTQNTYIFPAGPSLRLFTDLFRFSMQRTPAFKAVSISGYEIREAGATAVQELAFAFANAFTYVEEGLHAGLDVDEFVPQFSFFFSVHLDFFEEIAKFRAARRIWARSMREKYRARDTHSWALRFHAQTAAVTLAKQQPENNAVRTALEALAAVLGGAQSLRTNALTDATAQPGTAAAQLALRTQQILAYEANVAHSADPLGGSYFLESLTNTVEEEAETYFKKIVELGGVIRGIESGFFQREIAESAVRTQRETEIGRRVTVGVNRFRDVRELFPLPPPKAVPPQEKEQIAKLKALRRSRSRTAVERSLKELRKAARAKANVVPKILDCVRAYATMGEMVSALKEVYGEYEPPSVF